MFTAAPLAPLRAAHRRWRSAAWLLAALWLAGCASSVRPTIDNDPDAFALGMDSVLHVGMTIAEARAALHAKMPEPSFHSEVVSPIPTANKSLQNRRYMYGWPTLSENTTLVVTIFCDRDGIVVRWTTGPLHADR